MANKWLFCLFVLPSGIFAQTCCSGGVPVSSNIGFSPAYKGQVQFSLSYDYNRITRLYNEKVLLDDNNRMRSTQSYIFRMGYQWNTRFAGELFLPFIRQERRIETLSGGVDREASFGLGDPALLLSYDVLKNNLSWTLGLGLRLPLGSFSETNDRGLLLINDMQPGSGALDWIVRSTIYYSLASQPDVLYYFNIIHTQRGENQRYLGSQTYQFGPETQAIAGYSRSVFALKQIWPLALGLRYRHAVADKFNAEDLANTGGSWLFARVSLGFAFNPSTQIQFNVESPFVSRVTGVQLSPHYSFNISVLSKLKFNNNDF